jgi:hypothetical protein
MRNEYEDEIHNRENIKISVRKNDKNIDVLNTLKNEASKIGYDIIEVKEKETFTKYSDVIPWDSNWDKPERNKNLQKRLKAHENLPEPPKKKLAKDE